MRALKLAPHRTSCEKDTAGHGPRKTEKSYLGSKFLDLKGGWSLGELRKSLMDDCGIPFSFRTRSAGGESALFVARRSIYFDLFAALLNFEITPPLKWHPPYVNAHETPTRFLYPGDKKRLVRQGSTTEEWSGSLNGRKTWGRPFFMHQAA